MKSKHQILVTRQLSPEQIQFATDLNLSVSVEPAIDIRYRDNWVDVENLLNGIDKPIFAFTSQSGVEAFKQYMMKSGSNSTASISGQQAYAVGDKTAEALIKIGFIPLTPKQHDGTGLAELIKNDLSDAPKSAKTIVLHFCGNRRRDEFRQYLQNSGIKVRDVVVYQTLLNHMNLQLDGIDAILFYSPSAVQAFRKSGGFNSDSLPELFAIGQTTGHELSIESGRHVHISPKANTKTFLTYVQQILAGQLDEP